MATLIVGCGFKLAGSLQAEMPGEPLLVMEHPQLIERYGYRERLNSYAAVVGLIPADYVHGTDPLAPLLPAGPSVERVLPATDETSTVGAARVAAELGLPGAGLSAAGIFRDKLELRQAADSAGIVNPRWREVFDLPGLEKAVDELGSGDLVLKPSGRSGSQGVVLLEEGDDLADAWGHTTTAVGRVEMNPPPATRYLVEERVYGSEVSVECLVSDGEVVFANVTDKRVLPGRYPVEVGHVVPAAIPAVTEKELVTAMRSLVAAVGFGSGILHGEWILTGAGPVLVECAGRLPGDRITDLIALAYGVPFMARYAAMMTRGAAGSDMPETARQASAISFLTSSPGVVTEVSGLADAAASPGVKAAEVRIAAGDRVSAPRASRDRVGHVLAVAPDGAQAWDRAEQAAALIGITVQ